VKFRKWLLITRRDGRQQQCRPDLRLRGDGADSGRGADAYTDDIVRSARQRHVARLDPSAEILTRCRFQADELAEFKGVRSILPGRALMLDPNPTAPPERHPTAR